MIFFFIVEMWDVLLIYGLCDRGCDVVDVFVLGGDKGVKVGIFVIMVGGWKEIVSEIF